MCGFQPLRHIENKQKAFNRVYQLLNENGLFVLSVDKNQSEYIDMGDYKLKVFPDNAEDVKTYAEKAKLKLREEFQTELANIFVFAK